MSRTSTRPTLTHAQLEALEEGVMLLRWAVTSLDPEGWSSESDRMEALDSILRRKAARVTEILASCDLSAILGAHTQP